MLQIFSLLLFLFVCFLDPAQTVSVAIDETTVFGPRSMACLSPLPPDFEEIAKNEGQSDKRTVCTICSERSPESSHDLG